MRALAILFLSFGLLSASFVTAPEPVAAIETYPMAFPVQGPVSYSDTFGAPRSGDRSHEGIDMMAAKMIPVVAAASGTVGWMHDEVGGNCCAMALNHDDGWASWYIHLNNDTPGTDDGLGWGFAPGIESGVHVNRGQLIGYVGDSGNAEWTGSHLHFELHDPSGTPINAYPHLLAAEAAAARPVEPVELSGRYTGDEASDVLAFDTSTRSWTLFESDTDTFIASPVSVEPTPYQGSSYLHGDFSGDGIDDAATFDSLDGIWWVSTSSGSDFSTSVWADFYTAKGWTSQIVGDFNGDGKDDIANYHPSNGTWWISRSTGTSFTTSLWADFITAKGWTSQIVGDFNGDGKDDIANYHPSSDRWYVSKSTGSRFTTSLWATTPTYDHWSQARTHDVDGDGVDEILQLDAYDGSWHRGTSSGTVFNFEQLEDSPWRTTVGADGPAMSGPTLVTYFGQEFRWLRTDGLAGTEAVTSESDPLPLP